VRALIEGYEKAMESGGAKLAYRDRELYGKYTLMYGYWLKAAPGVV